MVAELVTAEGDLVHNRFIAAPTSSHAIGVVKLGPE